MYSCIFWVLSVYWVGRNSGRQQTLKTALWNREDLFLDQFFALIPNLRSDLAAAGSICPQSASKGQHFGLGARRDLHYVRARRCDVGAARSEPWHAMHQNVVVYTAVLY